MTAVYVHEVSAATGPDAWMRAEARLATRNVKDFDGTGIDLVDPWETRSG
jgi:hypothetical protein